MQAFFDYVRREPAMFVALLLTLTNAVFTLSVDQQVHVQTLVESVVLLVGGAAIRSQVTPVAKLS